MRNLVIRALFVGTLPLAAGCSDPISPESLAGTYAATEFTLSGEVSGDVLAAGGSLSITLNADGTTSGSVFVPAALNDGQDFSASLVGTFTLTDGSVTFTQDADTFVRDITWQVDGTRLRGAGTFSGVTITVVLTRQSSFLAGRDAANKPKLAALSF